MKLFEFKSTDEIIVGLEKIKTQLKTKNDEFSQLSTTIFNEKTIDGVKIEKNGQTKYFTVGYFVNSQGNNATSNVKKNMIMEITVTDNNGAMNFNITDCDSYPDLVTNDKLKSSVIIGNLKKGVITGKYICSDQSKISLVMSVLGIKGLNNFTYKHKAIQKNNYDDECYELYIDVINDINELDLFDKDFKNPEKSNSYQTIKEMFNLTNDIINAAVKEKKNRDSVKEQNAVAKLDRKINLMNDIKKCISLKTNNHFNVKKTNTVNATK